MQRFVIKKSKLSHTRNEQLANMVSKCITSKIGIGFLKSFEQGISLLVWVQTVYMCYSSGVEFMLFPGSPNSFFDIFSDTCQGIGD